MLAPSNEDRGAISEQVVRHYAFMKDRNRNLHDNELTDYAQDLISDICHLLHSRAFEVHDIIRVAVNNFDAEVDEQEHPDEDGSTAPAVAHIAGR